MRGSMGSPPDPRPVGVDERRGVKITPTRIWLRDAAYIALGRPGKVALFLSDADLLIVPANDLAVVKAPRGRCIFLRRRPYAGGLTCGEYDFTTEAPMGVVSIRIKDACGFGLTGLRHYRRRTCPQIVS